MAIEKNKCTTDINGIIDYIKNNFNREEFYFLKKLNELAFNLNKNESHKGFQVKCYITNVVDIRFCIDRGEDCEKKKKNTYFLILRKGYEVHVRDSGPYIVPQKGTPLQIIKREKYIENTGATKTYRYINDIQQHMIKSFCKVIRKIGLSSDLCVS